MARAARTRFGVLLGVLAAQACAPSSLRGRSIADPLDGPDQILAIGRADDVVYAVTSDHRLRAWNLRTRELRTLERAGAIGIARDGSIALRASGTVVEAWEPTSGRLIASHRFEHRIGMVRGVSPAIAYIVVKLPPVPGPPNKLPAPDEELLSWELASGKTDDIGGLDGCDKFGLSVDGARTLCNLGWRDRLSGVSRSLQTLAPEWAPPAPDPEPPCRPGVVCDPETGYDVTSAWLSADGQTVYVSYTRTEGGREWRLDRWIPDPAGKTDGRIEHLAVSHEPIDDRVVAVSQDGRTILTNPGPRPPVLRHAPGYEGVPLLAPPVIAAAFSQDESLIVTGHGDGRLRLWRADSGRFEAISPD